MKHVHLAGGFFVLSVLSISAMAAQYKKTSSVSDSLVVVTTTLPKSFPVMNALLEKPASQNPLIQAPYLKEIRDFAETPKTEVPGGANKVKVQWTETAYVQAADARALDPSLVSIQHTQNKCVTVKDDCKNDHQIVITGPIHSYSSVQRSAYMSVRGGVKGEALGRSFKITVTTTEVTAAETIVVYQMDILSRDYLTYIKMLADKGVLKEITTENQIKSAFGIWVDTVSDALAK